MPLLVWIQGLRGPEPQLWQEDQTTGSGKAKDINILAKHVVKEGAILETLAKLYPYEVKE